MIDFEIKKSKRWVFSVIAAVCGFAGGYLLFENVIFAGVFAAVTAVTAYICMPKKTKNRLKQQLLLHFKEYLEALGTAVAAGHSSHEAFSFGYEDVKRSYGSKTNITRFAKEAASGSRNGEGLQNSLKKAARRSEIEEIIMFAEMYSVIAEKGGDTKRIIAECRNSISKKIETKEKIETAVTSSKNELYIMMIMPFLIIPSVRVFIGQGTSSGTTVDFIIKSAAVVLFAAAYLIGKKITDIRV